ncbi:hypothetical protein Nepgr_011612 [Nepenthes gracilis]|uniref:Uncharacterized protein n=1 Tax=Nepenthes gracilis TaxID=150966 RepID=A0AAD3SFG0_NEPGR|nr:hypothetical protein Nepgr_011612 [Nepenthes gracilis]
MMRDTDAGQINSVLRFCPIKEMVDVGPRKICSFLKKSGTLGMHPSSLCHIKRLMCRSWQIQIPYQLSWLRFGYAVFRPLGGYRFWCLGFLFCSVELQWNAFFYPAVPAADAIVLKLLRDGASFSCSDEGLLLDLECSAASCRSSNLAPGWIQLLVSLNSTLLCSVAVERAFLLLFLLMLQLCCNSCRFVAMLSAGCIRLNAYAAVVMGSIAEMVGFWVGLDGPLSAVISGSLSAVWLAIGQLLSD